MGHYIAGPLHVGGELGGITAEDRCYCFGESLSGAGSRRCLRSAATTKEVCVTPRSRAICVSAAFTSSGNRNADAAVFGWLGDTR